MAIILPSGFNITNVDPIDARFSVSDQAARLGFSAANVYEGLVVYQRDVNELYVLTDTGSYSSTGGWTLVGSGAGSTFMATGSVTASVNITGDIFIIKSGSYNPFTVSSTGLTTISGSATNLFLIKNASNQPILTGKKELSHTHLTFCVALAEKKHTRRDRIFQTCCRDNCVSGA